MTLLLTAVVAFSAGVSVAWRIRTRVGDAVLSQALDDLQTARNDAAQWHRKAIVGGWKQQAQLVDRCRQLEAICAVNGVEIP